MLARTGFIHKKILTSQNSRKKNYISQLIGFVLVFSKLIYFLLIYLQWEDIILTWVIGIVGVTSSSQTDHTKFSHTKPKGICDFHSEFSFTHLLALVSSMCLPLSLAQTLPVPLLFPFQTEQNLYIFFQVAVTRSLFPSTFAGLFFSASYPHLCLFFQGTNGARL